MEKDCCSAKEGLVYGLIPHIGCILFLIFSILGATAAAALLRPLMEKSYFFYLLTAASLLIATLSAFFYLRKKNAVSLKGMKGNKKYLIILYGSVIFVNLLLIFVIFPMSANSPGQNNLIGDSEIMLAVNIPCPGHAPLITQYLMELNGVEEIGFEFPNKFRVNFDSSKVSVEKILSIDIFREYRAKVI